LSLDGGGPQIGSTTADDQGNFTATATIPSDSSAGQHNVLASCTDPNGADLVATAALSVTRSGLAVTGANFIPLAIVMVVTLAVGLILVLVGRRRRNRYEP
jgi:hypothetical protein